MFLSIVTTVLLYGLLAMVFFGYGQVLVLKVLRSVSEAERIPLSFLIWSGWACVFFIFQLIHFFLPINIYSTGPVFLTGIILSFITCSRKITSYCTSLLSGTLLPSTIPTIKFIGIVVAVLPALAATCWLTLRAMLPPFYYDSGLYYIQAIKWANEYPIIPGLGNLHGRLAFNPSFFNYVAALNLHPFFGNGRSIANSFLLLLTIFTLVELSLPFLCQPRLFCESSPLQWAVPLFCLPSVGFWALSSYGISSPAPDLTSSLLQVVIFVIFAEIIRRFIESQIVTLSETFILYLLDVTAIAVKLSNVAFCLSVLLLVTVLVLKAERRAPGHLVRFLFLPTSIVIVLCLQGIILTGAPIYPSTFGYVNTEWSVPIDDIVDMRNWIYSWSRQPFVHWKEVLGSWRWFAPWLQYVVNETDIVFHLAVFFVCSILVVFPLPPGGAQLSRKILLKGIILVPLLIALIFWFFTAPNPRFANGTFVLLPVSAISLLLTRTQASAIRTRMPAIICFLFIVSNLNILNWIHSNPYVFQSVSLTGWHSIQSVPLDIRVTESGLSVFVPTEGDQCWDAPLPCTPYFNESLRLRQPNDLSSGFFTVRPLHPLDSAR